MADETKTQIPKPTRQRGPMGRMGGMGRGEKPKDFKGTMRQLLGYIGQHKVAVFAAVAFAVCSVIFNIVGPKVLGQVTTKLFEGLVAKVNGTGDVDFNWIAKTLSFLLCLYLASSVCSLIQGWLMTGVTQKICYRMRKEIAAKIAVVPMGYFNGHSIMTLTVSNHFIILSRRKKKCLVRNFLLQYRCNLTNLDIIKIFRIIDPKRFQKGMVSWGN